MFDDTGAAPEGSTEPSIAAPKTATATARFIVCWFMVVSFWCLGVPQAAYPLIAAGLPEVAASWRLWRGGSVASAFQANQWTRPSARAVTWLLAGFVRLQ